MYAPIAKHEWPDGLEEAEYLFKELQRVAYGYGIDVCTLALAWQKNLAEPYEYTVYRWVSQPITRNSQRELVWRGTDKDMFISTLRMLVLVEKDKLRDMQNERDQLWR